jgi:hypothetical protein
MAPVHVKYIVQDVVVVMIVLVVLDGHNLGRRTRAKEEVECVAVTGTPVHCIHLLLTLFD